MQGRGAIAFSNGFSMLFLSLLDEATCWTRPIIWFFVSSFRHCHSASDQHYHRRLIWVCTLGASLLHFSGSFPVWWQATWRAEESHRSVLHVDVPWPPDGRNCTAKVREGEGEWITQSDIAVVYYTYLHIIFTYNIDDVHITYYYMIYNMIYYTLWFKHDTVTSLSNHRESGVHFRCIGPHWWNSRADTGRALFLRLGRLRSFFVGILLGNSHHGKFPSQHKDHGCTWKGTLFSAVLVVCVLAFCRLTRRSYKCCFPVIHSGSRLREVQSRSNFCGSLVYIVTVHSDKCFTVKFGLRAWIAILSILERWLCAIFLNLEFGWDLFVSLDASKP